MHARGRFVGIVIVLALVGVVPFAAPATAAVRSPRQALAELQAGLSRPILADTAPETGVLGFVQAARGQMLDRDDARLTAEHRALNFLGRHGELLGMSALQMRSPSSTFRVRDVVADDTGAEHVRLDQTYRGVPVFAAQIVVHMDRRGITGVNGSFVPRLAVGTRPAIGRTGAERIAVEHASKGGEAATPTSARLGVYRVGLIEGERGPSRLAWGVELSGREEVWVDAATGDVLRTIPLVHQAMDRAIYTPQYDPANPDLFLVRKEGAPATLVPPVDNLYDFAGHVHGFFMDNFGWDSYDNAGAKMRSVYLVDDGCPNAYWRSSTQSTNYCPGFDLDDVVAHEWGHAYTDGTHDLVYLCQPGALNESYSDIWGETIDLLNGVDGIGGNNNAEPYPQGQRWLVGEDLTETVDDALALRDMWDPVRRGHPDKISSSNYHCADSDNGGVHSNSAIPNHAYAMIVDGKEFGGRAVRGIGLTKAAHIYWRAQSRYQTYASKFRDHYLALRQSCTDLTGTDFADLSTGEPVGALTADDCAQVKLALELVGMQSAGPTQCGFVPVLKKTPPPVCTDAVEVYREDFEDGLDGWVAGNDGATPFWGNHSWSTADALPDNRAGVAAFAIDPRGGDCTAPLVQSAAGRFWIDGADVTMGAGRNVLRFTHYVHTELNRDGGNVQVSVNGSAFQQIPDDAYVYNSPNVQLREALTTGGPEFHPKAGQRIWAGRDGGEIDGSWGTTVIDLSPLAGDRDTVKVRFDFGIDCGIGSVGWYVDDVVIHACPQAQAVHED